MRAPSSSHRRLRSRLPHHPRLLDVARALDQLHVESDGHLAVHVGPGPDPEIGLLPLEAGTHPFPALAGLTAPDEWAAFGLVVRGTGHLLEEGRAEATTTTFLVHRSGEEVSLLRRAGEVQPIRDRAEGTLPDLCRRVLGLPTAPPPAPPSTAFTLAWLDAIVERWGDPAVRGSLGPAFADLAALHPAAGGDDRLDTPDALVAAAAEHARRWPWRLLRELPEALPLPGARLPADVTTWMDDGFYARWALGAFPDAERLARDVTALVVGDLRWPLVAALAGLLGTGDG